MNLIIKHCSSKQDKQTENKYLLSDKYLFYDVVRVCLTNKSVSGLFRTVTCSCYCMLCKLVRISAVEIQITSTGTVCLVDKSSE